MGGKRVPRPLRENLPVLISESIKNSKGPVKVHVPTNNVFDVHQTTFLPASLPNLEIIFHEISGSVAQEFKKRELLVPLVEAAFNYLE